MSEAELEEYENAIANGKYIIRIFDFREGSIGYYKVYSMINLIDKQQKEIEEYKKRLTPTPDNYVSIEYQMINYVDKRNYISKDKIRDKIKELQKNIPELQISTTLVNNIEKIQLLEELLGEENEK